MEENETVTKGNTLGKRAGRPVGSKPKGPQTALGRRHMSDRMEALRSQLKGSEYLRLIHQILARPNYEKGEIDTVKIKLDGYFRLLRKVLPDLSEIKAQVESTTVSLEDRVRARNLGLAVEEYLALREVRPTDLPAPIPGQFTREESKDDQN